MCLIVLAWQVHPVYDLIVAGNRDELHARPSAEADWWSDVPDVVAGRDLTAGGSWFAVSRSGRFASVTNYREQSFTKASYRSRGELVSGFVTSRISPKHFAASIDGDDFAGFSLLLADGESLEYASNRTDTRLSLKPGIYGLSNADLDTPWKKLVRSKTRLRQLIDDGDVSEKRLIQLLGDRETASEDVHADRLPFEQALASTAPFIVTNEFGTRCSTIYMRRRTGESRFVEKRFDAAGESVGVSSFRIRPPQQL